VIPDEVRRIRPDRQYRSTSSRASPIVWASATVRRDRTTRRSRIGSGTALDQRIVLTIRRILRTSSRDHGLSENLLFDQVRAEGGDERLGLGIHDRSGGWVARVVDEDVERDADRGLGRKSPRDDSLVAGVRTKNV